MMTTMTWKKLTIFVGIFLVSATMSRAADDAGDVIHPFLRIPEMRSAPKMDGKLNVDEWKGCAVFTGVSGSPLTTPFMLPEAQQVVWFMGFHGDKVYIGMRSPHPKGTFPRGRIKEPDNQDVLFEDHVEIQLCKYKPLDAGRPGKGFWKMVVNPWGAMHDRHWYNGTPASEDLWSTGGEVKCDVTDQEWQMEMSITAKNMEIKKLDGRKLLVQLVRASDTGGIYFAGWVGTNWMDWKHFAECDFDSQAPAIQFDKLGEIMEGEVDATFAIIGNSGQQLAVEVELLIENADGKVIYKEAQKATVARGDKKELVFKKSGIPVSSVKLTSKQRNYFQISATYKDGKKKKFLYFNRSPFMKMSPEWKRKYLDPWVESRQTAGEWEVNFANWIYSGKAQASVDVEFFGVDEKIKSAKKFSVQVKSSKSSQILAQTEADIKNFKGEAFFDVPKLQDGHYEAVFSVFAANGEKVGEKIVNFERKHFPFEHNQLGKSDEVIPPFWPLEANGSIIRGGNGRYTSGLKRNSENIVNAWGRVYEFNGDGLLKQILTTPPTGACGDVEPLLAAPMKLELKSNGQAVDWKTEKAPDIKIQPHRADVTGQAISNLINVDVKGFEDYDGWYEVEMNLTPKSDASIDSLDLVVELRDEKGENGKAKFPVNTLIAQRLGMGTESYYGGIPSKPGVHFKSTSLSGQFERSGPADIAKDWKSFVPVTYVGNGDRGLYFFAWSDVGWKMSDNDPVVTVERLKNGNVELRVRLISGLESCDTPRKLRFAIQASPIKANNPQYRDVVDTIIHDTSGYRYYGESVDGYCLNKDEDYDALRKYILYQARWSPQVRELDFSRLVLYGSQWMTGCGSEEFKTFGGEWLGSNNWKPDPDLKFADRWNMQHTNQWKTPEQLSPRRVNWPRSMLDFFVWYYHKHLTQTGINGTWWDNCYSGLITEYDPELGKLDSKWNFYFRRQLCKRLNVIGWQNMRRPCWIMGTPEMELSWCQVHWMVEGFWYSSTKNLSIWQNWNPDFMRSQIRPKGSVMISKAWLKGYEGSTPQEDERVKRSVMAVLLLHDLTPPKNIKYSKRDDIIRRLQYAVDYDNARECLYMNYSQSDMFVKPSSDKVLVSYYQNAKLRSAALILANTTSKDIALGGSKFSPAGIIGNDRATPAAAKHPMDLLRVYDLETDKEIKTTYRDGWLVIDEPMVVKRDGFRILALEAAK